MLNVNGAGSGSIKTRWQDVVLVAAHALQVPAAGVDLEAGQCGCRRVSVDICSFEDGVGNRDVGLRTVMYTPTRKGGGKNGRKFRARAARRKLGGCNCTPLNVLSVCFFLSVLLFPARSQILSRDAY